MTTLAFGMPGTVEWIIIAVFGLLIFGRRLPEVGRGLGRSIVEFRKGIKGIEDEIEVESAPKKPAAPEQLEGRSQAGPSGTAPFQAAEPRPAAGAGDSA